jgi:hypothetical protein
MTPGPPPGVLNTSFKNLPTNERPDASLWDTITTGGGNLRDAAARIGTEMNQTYRDTPDAITPYARDAVAGTGWLGRNVGAPVIEGVNSAVKDGSAIGAGGLAALSEIFSGGDPRLARDVHALLQVLPVAQVNSPPMIGPYVPREPSYTGKLPPADFPPPGAGGPTSPIYQPTTVPIKTPEDALSVARGLYKSADASGAQLHPQFTHDWLDSLDQYGNQTPAGLASAGPNATADLISSLRKTADAPMDSIQSIKEVDGTIQSAISKEYGSNGLSPEGKEMRQILQDFRNRYENVPPDQMSGSPQGIQDFQNARQAYAAYSRMRELQGVVDSTEGNPNRATLIASRANAFLNDPKNVRGWNDDEISAVRNAANSGFLQEWMRAEGSRLVGIGGAVMPGWMGKVVGVPAQVALSYAVRNGAENMRLAQLQKAMGVLGQRVPQPGTVPPQPPPFMPAQSAVTAARYAPLVGLLGQSQDQQPSQ